MLLKLAVFASSLFALTAYAGPPTHTLEYMTSLCKVATVGAGGKTVVRSTNDSVVRLGQPNPTAEKQAYDLCVKATEPEIKNLGAFGLTSSICENHTGNQDPYRRHGCYAFAAKRLGVQPCKKHTTESEAKASETSECYKKYFLKKSQRQDSVSNARDSNRWPTARREKVAIQ